MWSYAIFGLNFRFLNHGRRTNVLAVFAVVVDARSLRSLRSLRCGTAAPAAAPAAALALAAAAVAGFFVVVVAFAFVALVFVVAVAVDGFVDKKLVNVCCFNVDVDFDVVAGLPIVFAGATLGFDVACGAFAVAAAARDTTHNTNTNK